MSDGLIGGATAAPEKEAEAPAEISHIEKPAEPQQQSGGTEAWIQTVAGTLYVDGKPNLEALPEKYWKDGVPDIASALKARSELEKAFSRGDHKAPSEYDVSFAAQAGVPENDPLLGSFKNWAKENGVSQAAFERLAKDYIEFAQGQAKAVQIDVEREKQALGPQADKVIEEMVGWGQNLVRKGIWSADDFEEFKIMGGTARGLNALMKVREFYGDMRRIPTQVAEQADRPSRDELQQMIADPRYQKDPVYRSKVERLFEQMYAD